MQDHQMQVFLIGLVIFQSISTINAVICYECTDCPEPFTQNYPYVDIVNNTNFGAQCLKKVVNLGNGRRLISKGTVFSCPYLVGINDVQIFCCAQDYCNSSIRWIPSLLLMLFIVSACVITNNKRY